jgi:AcrR family transcriptional regulator
MAASASATSRRRAHAATAPRPDKRQAILDATVRLVARSGLHDTPMSALAREAGVAAGTLYLYFPGKEAMLNALYLELLAERDRALAVDAIAATGGDAREGFWTFWHRLARWHLEHREKSSVIQQCQTSAILTDETREAEMRLNADGLAQFEQAIARGSLRPLSRYVFWALMAGPIFLLAQMRDAGELEITDEVLRATFDGVCRAVLPDGAER